MKLFIRLQNFIYILQKEEYDNSRLIKWLPKFFLRFKNIQIREKLIWTNRVKVLMFSTALLQSLILTFTFTTLHFFIQIPLQYLLIILLLEIIILWFITPFILILLNGIMQYSVNIIQRKNRINNEKKLLKNKINGMKVVLIVGSFGKTTVKSYLYELVKLHYRTQMIEGNINTNNGISDWIKKYLKSNTELLLVEADTYKGGELALSTKLVHPDIVVLTNIGDQHLERFGSVEKLAKSLLESFEYSESNAKCIYRSEDSGYVNQLIHDNSITKERVFTQIQSNDNINITFAITVAKLLNIPDKFIPTSDEFIQSAKTVERRGNKMNFYGFECFDYSYNISLTTAKFTLEKISNYALNVEKQLIVITGGIPEILSENVLIDFGKLLNKYVDTTILAKSDCAELISQEIESDKTKLISEYKQLPKVLNDYSKEEFVILLFPELNDLYY